MSFLSLESHILTKQELRNRELWGPRYPVYFYCFWDPSSLNSEPSDKIMNKMAGDDWALMVLRPPERS